jgi:hypothetical protein
VARVRLELCTGACVPVLTAHDTPDADWTKGRVYYPRQTARCSLRLRPWQTGSRQSAYDIGHRLGCYTFPPLVHSTLFSTLINSHCYLHSGFIPYLRVHVSNQTGKMATCAVERNDSKGKGRADSGPDPNIRNSSSLDPAASSTEDSSARSSLRHGHQLDVIKQALQLKLGITTLPYLDKLDWMPRDGKGAPEKLRIGSRDDHEVFACFDAREDLIQQLRIVQVDGQNKHRDITKAEMNSLNLITPYAYLAGQDLTKRLAQIIRTFIKACFALRGHSAGYKVSVDLTSFARCAAIIHGKGYGSDTRSGGNDLQDADTASNSSTRSKIKVHNASSGRETLLMIARLLPQALRTPSHRMCQGALLPLLPVVRWHPSPRRRMTQRGRSTLRIHSLAKFQQRPAKRPRTTLSRVSRLVPIILGSQPLINAMVDQTVVALGCSRLELRHLPWSRISSQGERVGRVSPSINKSKAEVNIPDRQKHRRSECQISIAGARVAFA